jgi:hypothetical protein
MWERIKQELAESCGSITTVTHRGAKQGDEEGQRTTSVSSAGFSYNPLIELWMVACRQTVPGEITITTESRLTTQSGWFRM